MSNKSMSMTFSEDDLRTRSSHTSTTKPRQIVVRDKIPRTPPSRVATPKSNSQILSEERRRQISEILAEEERLQKKRKEEKKIQEEEELKKSQLKALEESRLKWENEILQNRMNELKLKENQQDSKLVIRPKSSSKPALEIAPFRKTKYRRFSDKKYYNWPSEEEEMHEIDVEDPTQEIFVTNPHDECELCKRGLEFERAELERKIFERRLQNHRSKHCQNIENYLHERHISRK